MSIDVRSGMGTVLLLYLLFIESLLMTREFVDRIQDESAPSLLRSDYVHKLTERLVRSLVMVENGRKMYNVQ